MDDVEKGNCTKRCSGITQSYTLNLEVNADVVVITAAFISLNR